MKVKKYLSPNDYYSYMNSNAWRNKHYNWLKQCGYRCSMFPVVRIGKYSSKKYGRYNMHHKYNSQFAIRNSLLNCELRTTNCELHMAPWRPNIIQKTLHLWCSLPLIFKQLILFGVGLLIAFSFSIWMALILGVVIFYLLFC